MDKKTKSSSVNIIIVVIVLTFVGRIMGMVRTVLIGARFGADFLSDIYLIGTAMTVTVFLGIGSAIATNIIPLTVRSRNDDTRDNQTGKIFMALVVLSLAIGIIYYMAVPWLLPIFAKGFVGEKAVLTVKAARLMVPTVLLITVNYFFVGTLQANKKYTMPALVSVPANVLFFLYLLSGASYDNVNDLAIITTLSWAVQILFLVPPMMKHRLISLKNIGPIFDAEVGRFLLGILPMVLVTLTLSLTIIMDGNIATTYDHGFASAVNYGKLLFVAIVYTTVHGITAVMFPKFSESSLKENLAEYYNSVINVLRSLALLLLPMSVGLIVLGRAVITMLFERGLFDEGDTMTTMIAFGGYTSLMLAFGFVDVLNKAFYALDNRRIPTVATCIILVTNGVLNWLLGGTFGFIGVIIATSLAYYVGAGYSFVVFIKGDQEGGMQRLFITFWKAMAASVTMGLVVYGFVELVSFTTVQSAKDLASMAIAILFGIMAYVIALLVLREKLVSYNVKLLKGRLFGGKDRE